MPALNIKNVPIEFPFEPYDCQVAYMEKVIECLEAADNALLESPTGTGKTLCLLCSTLGWQLKEKAFSQCSELNAGLEGRQPMIGGTSQSTILYASRTHSQLSQVVKELKNTVYRPSISILGSREQLCVNEEVIKLNGTVQNHACAQLNKHRGCRYRNNLEDTTRAPAQEGCAPLLDIEDLVAHGKTEKVCPYYMSREAMPQADLVLLPYNYLLDPVYRSAIKIQWQNSVVIFDEAHNVEKVASAAASFSLSSLDLAGAINEIDRCLAISLQPGYVVGDETGNPEPDRLAKIKEILLAVEAHLESIPVPGGDNGGKSFSGDYIFEIFAAAELNFQNYEVFNAEIDKAINLLLSESMGPSRNPQMEKIVKALRCVFRGESFDECMRMSWHYKVHIKTFKIQNNQSSFFARKKAQTARSLNYWCFCSGVAMENLKALGVRSVLLTSGTLSPLSSFALELRLPFNVTLENPHVISDCQVSVLIAKKGPMGNALESSYENRAKESYKVELACTISNVCRIVPKGGGVLVFFPSYSQMQACVEFWQSGKWWSNICKHKIPVIEPRSSSELGQVVELHEKNIKEKGGSVLFAVCRGKISEGIDFADHRARAVVVTGIPFPPSQDAQIKLKKQYMDSCPLPEGTTRLDGNSWYVQQAARAVNQALGRVVRHRLDYGAIVLCDERFTRPNLKNTLSKWIQPAIRNCDNFGQLSRGLTQFYKNVLANETLQNNLKDSQSTTVTQRKNIEEHEKVVDAPLSSAKVEVKEEALREGGKTTYIDPSIVQPANFRGWEEKIDALKNWKRPVEVKQPGSLQEALLRTRSTNRSENKSNAEAIALQTKILSLSERLKLQANAQHPQPPQEPISGLFKLKAKTIRPNEELQTSQREMSIDNRIHVPLEQKTKKDINMQMQNIKDFRKDTEVQSKTLGEEEKPGKAIFLSQQKLSSGIPLQKKKVHFNHQPFTDVSNPQKQGQNNKETNRKILKDLKHTFGKEVYIKIRDFLRDVHAQNQRESSNTPADRWLLPQAQEFIKVFSFKNEGDIDLLRKFSSFFPTNMSSCMENAINQHIINVTSRKDKRHLPLKLPEIKDVVKAHSLPSSNCNDQPPSQRGLKRKSTFTKDAPPSSASLHLVKQTKIASGGISKKTERELNIDAVLTQGEKIMRAIEDANRGVLADITKRRSSEMSHHNLIVCGICQDPAKKPYMPPCNHTFCKKCLKQWIAVRPECPTCRKRIENPAKELCKVKVV